MNVKKIVIFVSVFLIIITGVIIALFISFREHTYRILKIYQIEGEANVYRKEIGDISPYNNMVLESGDRVSLEKGTLNIQADEDKYIYLEEGTEIELKASGDSVNSKTSIELLKGAITNDIANQLPEEAAYEVNTPNSTMSVRGTIFRVYIYELDGVKYTRVSVFDGKVTTKLVYKDGTVADNEVAVEKGKEVLIYEDDKTTDYVSAPTDIDYDTLPEDVLRRLKANNDNGRQVSITNPEIDRILEGPYIVRFMYSGKQFGTQTVKKGEKVVRPTLKPSTSGDWDFDFSTPINRDCVIEWK